MSVISPEKNIAQSIILPNTSEKKVRERAIKMGYGDRLTREEAAPLYNAIISDTMEQIGAFLKSQKEGDFKGRQWITPNGFRADIGTLARKAIEDLYQVSPVPSFEELSQKESCWIF